MFRKLLILIVAFFASVLIGVGLLFVVSFVSGVGLEDLSDLGALTQTNTGYKGAIRMVIAIQHLCMFTLTAFFFAYFILSEKWLSYYRFTPPDISLLWKFVLLWIVAMPAIGASAAIFEFVDLPAWVSQMDDESIEQLMSILKMDEPIDLFVNILIVALIPALGEELIFRGIIQKELVKKMNPHLAIVLASFIFSAVHMQIVGFLPKFLIGLILGYSYFWTKSLWVPIFLHFLNNAFQTILLYVAGDIGASESDMVPSIWSLLFAFGFSCFLCMFVVQSIMTALEQKKNKNA